MLVAERRFPDSTLHCPPLHLVCNAQQARDMLALSMLPQHCETQLRGSLQHEVFAAVDDVFAERKTEQNHPGST